MRKLNKIKRSQGRILSVNEIFEKNLNVVKTYGIVLKYQSRTAIHNMYKEFRDTSLNGAVSQLCKFNLRFDLICFLDYLFLILFLYYLELILSNKSF